MNDPGLAHVRDERRMTAAGAAPARGRSVWFSGWTDGFLAFVARSHAGAVAVLMALSLAAFLPGFVSLQPMDRDEPRFAQASKQMLETGDFIAIRFQDEARNKKPIGIHWLQTATVAAAEQLGVPEARTTMALYRLPSLAGALALVLLTYWAALALVGRREAFLAAAFMAASILLGVEARLAKTDAVLAACCVALMGGLARAYVQRGRPLERSTLVLFWGAMALGILVKGPLAPLIVALPALALSIRSRSWRWLKALRPWIGLAAILVVVAPWFVAIAIRSDGAFFAEAVGNDMFAKVGSGQESHWAPPGAYFLVFFGTFWPIAPFAAMAVPVAWAARRTDAVAFCLAWIVPAWLLFEAVPTKLPHYVLPLYPAIAILTARALEAGAIGTARVGSTAVALLVPLIPVGLAIALTFAAVHFGEAFPYAIVALLAPAVVVAALAWLAFSYNRATRATLLAVAASIAVSVSVFGLAQPLLRSLKLSPRLADAARALDCPDPGFVTAGYREPSLVFLVGTDLKMADGAGAAEFLASRPCAMAFVESRQEGAFAAEVARLGASPSLVTRVTGVNINGGRRLDIAVYARKG